MPTLQDRIVWVTGAGSGIGRAIAISFAAAGARVGLTGRRVDALAQTASEIGQAAIVVPADVTNANQVAEAYETIQRAWGAVEFLVNNAGGNGGYRHGRLIRRGIATTRQCLRYDNRANGQPSMAILCAGDRKRIGRSSKCV